MIKQPLHPDGIRRRNRWITGSRELAGRVRKEEGRPILNVKRTIDFLSGNEREYQNYPEALILWKTLSIKTDH